MQLKFTVLELDCEFDFVISRGSLSKTRNVFVSITWQSAGQTYSGYGEAVPCPYYGETTESTVEFLEWVQSTELLSTLEPFEIQKFRDTFSQFSGHMAAKSALEMALYDIMGQVAKLPLWRLWGLNPEKAPKSSFTIGIAELEEVRRKTQIALSRGYDILKVKLGSPQDMAVIELIRELAGPFVTLRVDANAAWQPDDAIRMIQVLADYGVEFVEEPLQPDVRMSERLRVRECSPLPLIADESVHTLRDIPLVAQWMDGVNLKLTKTGGLTEALRMIHAARSHGLSIMLGCFVETSLSISAMAQLAPLVDFVDLDGALLLAQDPVSGFEWDKNRFVLSNRPGFGVNPSNIFKLAVS